MHTYIKTADTIIAVRGAAAATVRELADFKRLDWAVIKATPALRKKRELGVCVYTYLMGDGKLVRL